MCINISTLEKHADLLKENAELLQIAKETQHKLRDSYKPLLIDNNLIPSIILCMEKHIATRDHGTQTRVKLFILLYLYYPYSLVSDCRGNKDVEFRLIAKALQLRNENAYKYKKNLVFFYKKYKDFQRLVDKVYAYVYQEFVAQLPPL